MKHKIGFLIVLLMLPYVPTGSPLKTQLENVPTAASGINLPSLPSQGIQEIVLVFDEFQSLPHPFLFPHHIQKLRSIPAVLLNISHAEIPSLRSLPGLIHMEPSPKLFPLLSRSTRQLGIQQSFWEMGRTGNSNMSIAIFDTGLDHTHEAFQDRVIASYNAMSENTTSPIDNHGHGTHVTGIAAGSKDFPLKIVTKRGQLPIECTSSSCPLSLAESLVDVPTDGEISIELDWQDPGSDLPGSVVRLLVFDPQTGELACPNCNITGNEGYISANLRLKPGDFFIGLANMAGAAGQPYEFAIQYNWKTSQSRFPSHAGVAYTSNIINVKVLDGIQGGKLTFFDNAVAWVINNRKNYNISVVNISLGLNQTSLALNNLISQLADNGIVPVVAAGNSGPNSGGVYSPASAPESIAVGSVNHLNEIAFYTNVGTANVNDDIIKPDILAPGGSIASTAAGFLTSYQPGFGLIDSMDANIGINLREHDLTGQQGTSMAAPHIAGLALLVANYLQETEGWDWESRTSAMQVKRLILASAFEVPNIGSYGREQMPQITNPIGPSLDRISKDYHEGWGAVDSRAVALPISEVEPSHSETFTLSLQDPFLQKVKLWKVQMQANTSYSFLLDVPEGVDADLRIIDAETGPTFAGKDYGDLSIIDSSTNGLGQDEGIVVISDREREVYVRSSIIQGDRPASFGFEMTNNSILPFVEITSPADGDTLKLPFPVEFESDQDLVQLSVDGNDFGLIPSGYMIEDLATGQHTIQLSRITASGYQSVDHITIEVQSGLANLSSPILIGSVGLLFLLLILFIRKRQLYG